MSEDNPNPSHALSRERALIIGVLGLALAVRVVHLSSAMVSPLTYQPGPDEDYYLRLGQAVASGHGDESGEFTFMDPAYGYLLGGVFKLFGVNLFIVYLLQALLDTATAYAVFSIGCRLDRPRAGLFGAAVYALTSTAIMFSTTLLKESWVTSFLAWWVVSALALIKSERKLAWLAFGVFCGTGVALRSTLWEMGILALLLPLLGTWPNPRRAGSWFPLALMVVAGMAIALLPWSIRNEQANGIFTPVPHNGGIVLHQAYNADNPDSSIWIPDFVGYSHPSEIWRGYAAEASRREGRQLSPTEVDHFWRTMALQYMAANPSIVLRDIVRKAVNFFSATEVPNNRFSVEERMFSPVLSILPSPTPWLLAMGFAGLLWLALEDRRWPIVAAPICIAWLTFAMFWAEDRFRFHAMGVLAFCCGYLIDRLVETLRGPRKLQPLAFTTLAAAIAGVSLYLGSLIPPPLVRWDHIVWGYVKMGRVAQAQSIALRIVQEQPENAPVLEALGFTAAIRQQYPEAKAYLQHAIALRPRSHIAHYNLARVLLAASDRTHAAEEARIAVSLYPSPDYVALLSQIEHTP
jgi:hypothetical protein